MRTASFLLATVLVLATAAGANAQQRGGASFAPGGYVPGSFGGGSAYGGGGGFAGGAPYGGGSGMSGTNTSGGYYGPTGSMYYPGFGWSSRPLNTYGYGQPYYGNGYGLPMVAAPMAVPGGYYRIGNMRMNFWQGPSGYYYPWGVGAAGFTGNTIYLTQQGMTSPAKPPLSSMFGDMEKYLDDSKQKGKVAENDYNHLFQRLHDLRGKYDHMMSEDDGMLDPSDEASIRGDADRLSEEIAQRVKPMAAQR